MDFLTENRGALRKRLAEESPEWVPEWVDDRVFTKAFATLQSFLSDVTLDSHHELRRAYDTYLREFAEKLRTDPEQARKIEDAKVQLLDHPAVRAWLTTLWIRAKALVLDGAADPSSDLRAAVERMTIRVGEVLRDDPVAGGKIDDALQRLSAHVVTNYADDLAAVISTTVQRWDTEETSQRLELQVGRDLQFIRINGTVVGSLAGLAIYAASQLF
jgi:uncharacterized membrane-anchored protein YjiN (DUF445 family)